MWLCLYFENNSFVFVDINFYSKDRILSVLPSLERDVEKTADSYQQSFYICFWIVPENV